MNGSPVTLRFHVGRIDDSTGSPIVHRINDVDVDPAVVADVQTFVRWTWRELREHEQRAELQRKRVDDLEAERDAEADRVAAAEARQLALAHEAEVLREGYHAAMAESGRLRALLGRALDGWAELDRWIADDRSGGLAHELEIADIRREAGLA